MSVESIPCFKRVSVRPGDSGHHTYSTFRSNGYKVVVRLNGELQTACITADPECGMVVRLATDKKGFFQYDAARECYEDEVAHGKVELHLIRETLL